MDSSLAQKRWQLQQTIYYFFQECALKKFFQVSVCRLFHHQSSWNTGKIQLAFSVSLWKAWNNCEIPVNCLSFSASSFICSLGVVFNSWDCVLVAVLESEQLNPFSYRVCQVQVMEQWAVFLVHKPVLGYPGEKLTWWLYGDWLPVSCKLWLILAWNLSVSPEKPTLMLVPNASICIYLHWICLSQKRQIYLNRQQGTW